MNLWSEGTGSAFSSSCLLGGLLGLLLSLASVLLVDLHLAELSENLGARELLGDLQRSLSLLDSRLLDNMLAGVLGDGSELVSSRVSNGALLWLVSSSGEEDQVASVLFKSLHIQLKGLLRQIVSSVIDGDADGSSESWADLSLTELLKTEASAVS